MSDVMKYSGKINFPHVHNKTKIVDPLLQAVYHNEKQGPWIGSIPNRFFAELGPDYHPDQTVKAVKKAWFRIANTIWNNVVEPAADLGNGTQEPSCSAKPIRSPSIPRM
ncbi:hypothetical protein MK805_11795 [Shimazuella sp. AN120528]|uniref:hypothetical protein n=1 Tax=Shimazuella soli TaxID=1892854 RepID=UPI001F0F4F2C|nr:hypothetical protein [Shimazuella soli]MCH5585627.1 hypothetical protein [Shimazuella soli]